VYQLMSVRGSSIEAYHQLKEEGKISEKRSVAFNALKEYAESEDTDRWPTKVELYEWAQGHLDNEEFPFSRFGNFKPRITELTPGSDATDVGLVEYLDEKREQDSDTTERSAHPVKILSYQSTLSSESGEAAELQEEQDGSSSGSGTDRPGRDIEIPYSVDGGNEVRMANPEEAIAQSDDLDEVEKMLEAKDLLSEYKQDIEAVRDDSETSDDVDESGQEEGEDGTVEKDGTEYVFDPDEDSDEEPEEESESVDVEDSNDYDGDEDSEDQTVLMRNGEVVV